MVHQKLDISVYRESNETIVALTGEIDLHTAPSLNGAVETALADAPARVVLDMGGVTFCDSRGLGTLVVLSRTVTRGRAVLVLANLGDFLNRLLSVSGIGEHFVIRGRDADGSAPADPDAGSGAGTDPRPGSGSAPDSEENAS
ncbi:STAS domain-containing protein [Glycomyces buryatensis]|uniref:Anti-sigma factor antagonist n=1 Tax=Glycomyces buryatensis TaxID=2570927 RepID=A0A4S8Q9E1_9ACTN|nr:STAS domain-containing protein [Glycomyces buryatensis]THV40948.1 STAS domain-containing protein [Glycomyces buryatensis]